MGAVVVDRPATVGHRMARLHAFDVENLHAVLPHLDRAAEIAGTDVARLEVEPSPDGHLDGRDPGLRAVLSRARTFDTEAVPPDQDEAHRVARADVAPAEDEERVVPPRRQRHARLELEPVGPALGVEPVVLRNEIPRRVVELAVLPRFLPAKQPARRHLVSRDGELHGPGAAVRVVAARHGVGGAGVELAAAAIAGPLVEIALLLAGVPEHPRRRVRRRRARRHRHQQVRPLRDDNAQRNDQRRRCENQAGTHAALHGRLAAASIETLYAT